MRQVSLLAAALLVAAPISAQAFFIPSDTPTTGTCNVIPFGTVNTSATWVNQVYQAVATDTDLGNPTTPLLLCDLAFASCGANQVRFFDSIQITFGQLPGGVLGATFAANLVNNVKVVLAEKNYTWNTTADTWSDIGLTSPYAYQPGQGDLVVEILAMGNNLIGGSGTGFHRDVLQRAYAFTWVGSPPPSGTVAAGALKMRLTSGLAGITSHGTACGGPLALSVIGGSSQFGQSLGMQVDNATAGTNGPFFVCFGTSLIYLDLGFLGATGCTVYPSPFVCLLGQGSPAQVKIAVPANRALLCGILFAQGIALNSTANTAGIETSNYLRIQVGN